MPACLVLLHIVFYTTFLLLQRQRTFYSYLSPSDFFLLASYLLLPLDQSTRSPSPSCVLLSVVTAQRECAREQLLFVTASAAQKPDRNLCRGSSAPRSLAYPADTYTLTTNTCRPRGRPTPHVSAVNLFIHTHVRTPTSSVIQISSLFIHLQPSLALSEGSSTHGPLKEAINYTLITTYGVDTG